MERLLRLLLVEDNPNDAWVIERRLKVAGYELESVRVESGIDLTAALENEWDIILADYNLPGFSGLEALRLVQEREMDIPLVLVSGAIDVPTALEAMRAGARDFLFKDDLERLPSVIDRETAEALERRERRRAERERDIALAELSESNERLAAFASLTDFPLRDLSLEQLLAALLQRIADGLEADGAAVLLLEGSRLIPAGAIGPGAASTGVVIWGEGVAGRVADTDKPLHQMVSEFTVADGEPEPGCGVSSILGVPMHYDGELVGVLRVDWCGPHEVAESEISLLELAADRCAMAIENTRLYSREHRAVETLQLALMSVPDDLCGLRIGQFYCSATDETLVGGDFFDVFEIRPGHVAIAVGDVAGKGLKAAVVTAQVRNAFRAHAIDGETPAAVLTKTNTLLERFTESETFVTAFFGVITVDTGVLEFACAGHLPPVVAGPGIARRLEEGGPVLGAFDGIEYEGATTVLTPEETLVLFTDGLTEARSPWGVFFGEDRILALLEETDREPIETAALLKREVIDFSGGRLRDDVAVLAVQLAPGECPSSTALGCG